MASKKDIIDATKVLFAHTDALSLAATFSNRFDSRTFLRKQIEIGGKHVIVISDILGSGKTFLMTMVQGELGLRDRRALKCGWVEPTKLATEAPVFIDEWDVRSRPDRIIETVALLKGKMENQAGPVVLLGDLTLKSEAMRSLLLQVAPVSFVPMEPLSPSFFDMALKQRLEKAAENLKRDLMGSPILEPTLQAALVPDWKLQTSANFRSVFSTLTQMSQELEPEKSSGGFIGEPEATAWIAKQVLPSMAPGQAKFYSQYCKYVHLSVRDGDWSKIGPLTDEELIHATGFGHVDMEEFRIEIVEPLARSGLLSPMGYPEISTDGSTYRKYPAPYLPGILTRIRALYGVFQ